MEKLVFVIGDKQNPEGRHIKRSGSVTIGRGFTCDIILNDPHIEALQLICHLEEGVRTVEVFGSTNPVLRNGEVIRPGHYPFDSGDEWAIGKTRLHVFHEHHRIEPTEKMLVPEFSGGLVSQVILVLAGAVMLCGWVVFQAWLGSYQPLEPGKDIAEAVTNSGYVWFVLMWSCMMALSCRSRSGRSQFGWFLLAGALYVIADQCFDAVFSYATYGFNLGEYWRIISLAGSVMLLAGFMWVCYSLIMNMRGMKHLALGLAVCWFGFQYLSDVADQDPLEPVFNQTMKPPFALLVEPQSIERFIQVNKTAFAEIASED